MTIPVSSNLLSRWATLATVALAALSAGVALAAGPFDTGYRIVNDGLPITEVFDDGSKTYLVVGRNATPKLLDEMAKSLVVTRGGEVVPASLVLSSPYLTISGVYERISIAAGGHRAIALYGGQRGPAALPEKPAAMPAPEKAVSGKPVPGKPVMNRAPEAPGNPAPAVGADEAPANAQADATPEDIAAFKVTVPFVQGKAALGKEAERALKEIEEVGPIAREILIRVPGDPSGDLTVAHGRAAEIHRLLVRMGLVRQRITIEAFKPLSDGRLAGEVTLFVDLNQKRKAK